MPRLPPSTSAPSVEPNNSEIQPAVARGLPGPAGRSRSLQPSGRPVRHTRRGRGPDGRAGARPEGEPLESGADQGVGSPRRHPAAADLRAWTYPALSRVPEVPGAVGPGWRRTWVAGTASGLPGADLQAARATSASGIVGRQSVVAGHPAERDAVASGPGRVPLGPAEDRGAPARAQAA